MNRAQDRRITSAGFAVALSVAFAGWLVGCTNTPQTAVASVTATEAALAAAGKTILTCYSVPKCAAAAPKPAIKAAYDSAYEAVTRAQTVADAGGSPDMASVSALIAALQSAVAQLPSATP